MTSHKTYFNWSSGKDATMALYQLQQHGQYHIDRLITTVNGHYDRVTMHGLRNVLLEQQCEAIGIHLERIELPESPSMETYNSIMTKAVDRYKKEGYSHCGFGDIFLEDLKTYREQQLLPYGITAVFPLWKKDTKTLIQEFIDLGFKAVIICINAEKLEASFVGREIGETFMNDLPDDVDPCGEYGEFHTFCYDGPIFKHPVEFKRGEKTYRTYDLDKDTTIGYWFQDLLPA